MRHTNNCNAMEIKTIENVGSWGEETARKHLESKGYVILEQNWRCSHREVDIIAKQNNIVIFVEVKTRTSSFRSPIDAVDRQKQKLLISAANYYVRQKNLDCDIRFDIISIVVSNGSVDLEHIENAFYPRVR